MMQHRLAILRIFDQSIPLITKREEIHKGGKNKILCSCFVLEPLSHLHFLTLDACDNSSFQIYYLAFKDKSR